VAATDFDGFAGWRSGPQEQDGPPAARARAWVRKEAVLKATGSGLATDPRTVDVRGSRVLGAHLLDVPAPDGWPARWRC
jgi:4'-phosphopantetheinyl transferase